MLIIIIIFLPSIIRGFFSEGRDVVISIFFFIFFFEKGWGKEAVARICRDYVSILSYNTNPLGELIDLPPPLTSIFFQDDIQRFFFSDTPSSTPLDISVSHNLFLSLPFFITLSSLSFFISLFLY